MRHISTSNSIVFSTELDNKQLEKELSRVTREIEKLEQKINSYESRKSPLVQEAEELNSKIKAARAEVEKYRQAWVNGEVGADKKQSDAAAELEKLSQAYSRIVEKIDKIDSNLLPAQTQLEKMREDAGGLAQQLEEASQQSSRMKQATETVEDYLSRFSDKCKQLVKRVFVFSLISSAMRSMKDWLWKVIKSNDEASQAVARLKGALLTMAQPIVEIIVPAFTALVNILTKIISVVGRIVAAFSGKTYEETKDAAAALDKEANALEGVGEAAEEAAGSLAGFDEINTITTETVSVGTSFDTISPDFSAIQALPEWLESLTSALEIKIRELRFSWNEEDLLESKDFWIMALSSILGAVIGFTFGGFTGATIGLLLGAAISLISLEFTEKMDNTEQAKDAFLVILSGLLGAVLGSIFGGLAGAAIGLLLGVAISLVWLHFFDKQEDTEKAKGMFEDVLDVMLFAVLGGIFGGLVGGLGGAAIGVLLGAAISLIWLHFFDKQEDTEKAKGMFEDVLDVMLFAVLGGIFGGLVGGLGGAAIGVLLGVAISLISAKFSNAMNDNNETAKTTLKTALTTIIGALIGAVFGGGVFGAIAGGVIGLTLGVALTLFADSVDTTNLKKKVSGSSTSISGNYSMATPNSASAIEFAAIPRLATGTVVPPNREFAAILGDNKTETEIVSPLSTMKQAMLEALRESGGAGGDITITVVSQLDGKEVARNTVKHVNTMTRQAGKSVLLV